MNFNVIWAAARLCHALNMQFPDVSILYTAMTSIVSAVFGNVDDNMRLRWITVHNSLNLPQVVTVPNMKTVAEFAERELACMALHGGRTGNPGLPLTGNQKRQDAQKKEQVKQRAAAVKGPGGPCRSRTAEGGGRQRESERSEGGTNLHHYF